MPTPTSLRFNGNWTLNLTDHSQPGPNPVEFALPLFTQYAAMGLNYATAQTNLAVGAGSITAPKCIYVELISGTIDLKWDTNVGTVPTRLSMDADPAPTQRAQIILFTPVAAARTLYVTSPGAVNARIWFFQ